jgi:hypothetical protein
MNTKIAPTDLTQRPPRSFHVRLGGFVILPRMLDKGRATLVKKNGDYNYNSSTDQHLVRFLGFDPDALVKELGAGKGDGEILEWVLAHSKIPRAPWEIEAWSAYMERRGPDSDGETLAGLPSTSGDTAKLAKTLSHGSTPLNSMTTRALEEQRNFRAHENNEEQKQKRSKQI